MLDVFESTDFKSHITQEGESKTKKPLKSGFDVFTILKYTFVYILIYV
jgi:hypothetical protein